MGGVSLRLSSSFSDKISLRSLRTESIDGVALGSRSGRDVVPLDFSLLLWLRRVMAATHCCNDDIFGHSLLPD